jgi:hypothetical protein
MGRLRLRAEAGSFWVRLYSPHTKYEDFTALWTIFTQTKGTFKSPKGSLSIPNKGATRMTITFAMKIPS